MKTCYYAHFMGIYNTPQEDRDVQTLTNLGFHVTNPNSLSLQILFEAYKEEYPDDYMTFFTQRAAQHDVVAFRSLPDGSIPGGVKMEVMAAKEAGRIIIELPCGLHRRGMDHATTVEYLENIGQR